MISEEYLAILFSPFCSSSRRQCNDTRYCAVALLCCQSSCQAPGAIFRARTCIIKVPSWGTSQYLNKIERKIATCFVECYVLIVLGSCYHIVLWSTEFATNCLVIIYHSLALGISRIQILKKIHNDALFSRWHVAAIGYKSLQMAAITCFHMQPLPATCSHFPKQPLAATSNHLQPLAATSSHLQPLATTCPSSHKQPLAAICSHKQPQATSCNHLPKQPLAATSSHWQVAASGCFF